MSTPVMQFTAEKYTNKWKILLQLKYKKLLCNDVSVDENVINITILRSYCTTNGNRQRANIKIVTCTVETKLQMQFNSEFNTE